MWVSGTSQFYSVEDVENSAKLSNTDSNDAISDSTNKSVSKMRSYLRRCESAINSINLSAKRSLSLSSPSTPTTSNNAVGISNSTNSSWYVDEFDPESTESANESNGINNKSDTMTQHQLKPLVQNSDEQAMTVRCKNENANNSTPQLQQQQITLSPVSKRNEIH